MGKQGLSTSYLSLYDMSGKYNVQYTGSLERSFSVAILLLNFGALSNEIRLFVFNHSTYYYLETTKVIGIIGPKEFSLFQ